MDEELMDIANDLDRILAKLTRYQQMVDEAKERVLNG
jgi:hypothetical protein